MTALKRIAARLLYPVVPELRAVEMAEELRRLGWLRSHRTGLAVSEEGLPLPWWTYPAMRYIERRLAPSFRVFEWGAGHSTLWLADQVAEVISVENDTAWYEKLDEIRPENVKLVLSDVGGSYATEIKGTGPFDMIVIDGRDRVTCSKLAVPELADGGLIVWDNSERLEYEEGLSELVRLGFSRIDFAGFGPINTYVWSTSVFQPSP